MSQDYYQVLGLPRNAGEKEIKQAYKKLALLFHPDKNTLQGAEEKFKEILEAYEVLNDADRKMAYDEKYEDSRAQFHKINSETSRLNFKSNFQFPARHLNEDFRSFFGDSDRIHRAHRAMLEQHMQLQYNFHNRVFNHFDHPLRLHQNYIQNTQVSAKNFQNGLFRNHFSTSISSCKPTRIIPIIIQDK